MIEEKEPSFERAAVLTVLGELKEQATRWVVGEKNRMPATFPLTIKQANWLVSQELGALANKVWQVDNAEVHHRLNHDSMQIVAKNSIHFTNLTQISTAFAENNIPIVLLKGVALASTTYPDPMCRSMSDIDLWVLDQDMPQAIAILKQLGFLQHHGKEHRPLALRKLSAGEVAFHRQGWQDGLVELHFSPFPGWWLKRGAGINDPKIWQRLIPHPATSSAQQLTPEDNLIHVAVHLAVNHQFTEGCIRSLMDLALIAGIQPIDWQILSQRVKKWRVNLAVWFALWMSDQIFNVSEADSFLKANQPSRWRRWLFSQFVTPETILAGKRLSNSWRRYFYLFVLIDRWQDALYSFYRAFFPEKEWLTARYGRPVSYFYHFREVIRQKKL